MTQQPVDPRSRVERRTGTILVTGATGLVGRAVCRALADRKLKFRALVRVSSDRSTIEGTGAWMNEGDLLRPESLDAALDGVEVILHLAGLVKNKDARALHAVHVDGTRALIERSKARRVVALSSDTVERTHRSPYADASGRWRRCWPTAIERSWSCARR